MSLRRVLCEIISIPVVLVLTHATAASADWEQTNLGIENAHAREMAVAPSQPSRVFLSLTGLGPFRTDDRGASWTRVSQGLPLGKHLEEPAVAPTDADAVYGGVSRSAPTPAQIYRSGDGGVSWELRSNGIDASHVEDILARAVDPDAAFAALSGGNAPGVYTTTDGGLNWSRIATIPGDPTVLALAAHPANPDLILGGVNDGVVRTTDGGASWAPGTPVGMPFEALTWAGDDPWRVYARSGTRVFRSDDLGQSFTETNHPSGLEDYILGVAGHPTDDMKLLAAGTGYGGFNYYPGKAWKTTDGGSSWSTIFTDGSSIPLHPAYDPLHPDHVYVGEDGQGQRGFRYSSDGGASWTTRISGLANVRVEAIRGDLAGVNYARWNDHLLRSSGSIGSWTDLGPTPGNFIWLHSEGLEVNFSNPSILFEHGEALSGDIAFHFLNRSVDSGATWEPGNGFPPNIPSSATVYSVVSNHGTGARVYAFTSDGLFRSDDTGETFNLVNPMPPGGARGARTSAATLGAIFPAGTDFFLVVASGWEVFWSSDGGFTFAPVSGGLPATSGSIESLFMSRVTGCMQVLFTNGDVYETPSVGMPWTKRFAIDLQGASVVRVAWDPASGHVFVATSNAGVVSSHPDFVPQGLPVAQLETIHYSPSQNTLLVGTTYGGAFHQVVAPPVTVPETVAGPGAGLRLFPNPSAGPIGVEFRVQAAGARVGLTVYDTRGRKVRTLADQRFAAGLRRVEWDGRSAAGRRLPAGVYFVRLQIGDEVITSKTVRVP